MESEQIFDLCSDGEQIIKNYECTNVRRLFFGSSTGQLTLTNKRILYYATGKSIKGKSLVLSEMPIDDVTGISTYMGTSINWLFLIIFTLALYYIVTPFILYTFPSFLTHIGFSILVMIPYLIIWIWDKNIINNDIKEQVREKFKGVEENIYVKNLPIKIINKIFFFLFIYGAYIITMKILSGNIKFLRFVVFIILFFRLYGPMRVFSLLVYSKSTKGAGIYLPGIQKLAILNFKTNDTTAADTMAGSPARDSELIIKELGAIITDLKQMGDLAIPKWQ